MSTNIFDIETASGTSANIFDSTGALPTLMPQGTASEGTPTPLGFVRNLIGDVGELAEGITSLIGAAGHDIVAGVQHIIPGEQQAEQEGFKLAAMGRMFFPALASDYAARYGGATNIARGLYEDPLSYLLDVLSLGGGAAALAKAGNLSGTLWSKLPQLVSEETAARILGASVAEGARPTIRVANTLLNPEVPFEQLAVSMNPATRTLQRGFWRGLSLGPDSRQVVSLMDNLGESTSASTRAQAAISYAQQNGIRVFRPTGLGQRIAGVQARVSALAGKARVNTRQLTQEQRAAVEQALSTAEDPDIASQYWRGVATPEQPINYGPIDIGVRSAGEPLPSSPIDNVDMLYALRAKLGNDHAHPTNINTPHSVMGTPSHSYTVIADTADDLVRVGDEALATLGLRRYASRNYFDQEVSYDGYHVFGVDAEGRRVDISVATKDLYQAQRTHSPFAAHLDRQATKLLELEEKIRDVGADAVEGVSKARKPFNASSVTGMRIVDEYASVAAEIAALQELGKTQFFLPRVLAHAGDGADSNLVAALRAESVFTNGVVERWFKNHGGTALEYWKRSFLEQRVQKFYRMLGDLKSRFSDRIAENSTDMTLNLTELLEEYGIPPHLIQYILKKEPKGGIKHANREATRLTRHMRNTLWRYMVDEGDRGVEWGFPQYDWRVMMADRKLNGQTIPSYFPHYAEKVSHLTGFMREGVSTQKPGITKPTRAILLEEGRFITDPVEAASRAAAELTRHSEGISLIKTLLAATGRELTQKQAATFRSGFGAGEVMIAPDELARLLSLRAEILSDTLDEIANFGTEPGEATLRAVESLMEKAAEEALNSQNGSRVWAVPELVAKQLQRELKSNLDYEALRIYYDGPMNLWKASVLAFSPRWLINNFFGNKVFLGIENPGALRLGLAQLEKRTASVTNDILDLFDVHPERGFFQEIEQFGSVLPKEGGNLAVQRARWARDSLLGKKLSQWSAWTRRKNTILEQADRRGVLLNELQKREFGDWVQGAHSTYEILNRALREGKLTPAKMDDIVGAVDRTLGNYTSFSPVEQNIIKRFIAPFWGFYRHAIKVLLRLPIEHPLKAKLLMTVEQMDTEMMGEYPEWLRGSVPLGLLGGEQTFLRLKNLNPLAQISEEIPLVSILNPVAKFYLERQLGIDTFTGEPFKTPDNVYRTYGGTYYQKVTDANGNVIGVELMTRPPTPGMVNHLGSIFPQLQLFSAFERYPKSLELQLAGLVGVPLSQVDIEGILESQQTGAEQATSYFQNQAAPEGNIFDG